MKISNLNFTEIDKIRPLWEKLNKLHAQLSPHFQSYFENQTFEDRLNSLTEKNHTAVFIAHENSNIIGYCITSITNNEGEIDSLYIDPEFRSSKVGKNLIKHAENWLQSYGVDEICISIAAGNESVHEFYQKQDYYHCSTTFVKKHNKSL